MLFSYGLREILREINLHCDELSSATGIHAVKIYAYLDDIVFVVPPVIAEAVFDFTQQRLASIGLEVNMEITHLGSLLVTFHPEIWRDFGRVLAWCY